MSRLQKLVNGKFSRGDEGLTTTGLIIVCVLVSVAAIIILLALLGKF